MGRKTESHGSLSGSVGQQFHRAPPPHRGLGDQLGGVIFGATSDTIKGAAPPLFLPLAVGEKTITKYVRLE